MLLSHVVVAVCSVSQTSCHSIGNFCLLGLSCSAFDRLGMLMIHGFIEKILVVNLFL